MISFWLDSGHADLNENVLLLIACSHEERKKMNAPTSFTDSWTLLIISRMVQRISVEQGVFVFFCVTFFWRRASSHRLYWHGVRWMLDDWSSPTNSFVKATARRRTDYWVNIDPNRRWGPKNTFDWSIRNNRWENGFNAHDAHLGTLARSGQFWEEDDERKPSNKKKTRALQFIWHRRPVQGRRAERCHGKVSRGLGTPPKVLCRWKQSKASHQVGIRKPINKRRTGVGSSQSTALTAAIWPNVAPDRCWTD